MNIYSAGFADDWKSVLMFRDWAGLRSLGLGYLVMTQENVASVTSEFVASLPWANLQVL